MDKKYKQMIFTETTNFYQVAKGDFIALTKQLAAQAAEIKKLRKIVNDAVIPLRFLASMPAKILPFESRDFPDMAQAILNETGGE